MPHPIGIAARMQASGAGAHAAPPTAAARRPHAPGLQWLEVSAGLAAARRQASAGREATVG